MTVRAFVAIFPPREIQETLHRTALALPIEGTIRYIRPENIHLTLKFLGDVQPETLAEANDALAAVGARHDPFEVELVGFGAFPSERRGRVLWASAGRGTKHLNTIAADVEDALEPLGFERDPRAYKPHLTLGRARASSFVLDAPTALERLAFRAERLTLVRSVLQAEGAVYEPLDAYPLIGG